MIVVIDYGMGNLRSVFKCLDRMSIAAVISSDADVIREARKLILPGVGHFARGMQNIRELGLLDLLNHKVLIEKTPILGICLGMQLFTRWSEEGEVEGLGWLDAKTVKFDVSDRYKFKVPHIGWNSLSIEKSNILFSDLNDEDMFYFVHSYHVVSNEAQVILASTEYDYSFHSAVHRENIYGTQFHPEKSHHSGMKILKNFVNAG